MKDKHGNILVDRDYAYYTERPYSYYADSLVEIVEKEDKKDILRIKIKALK